MKTGGQTSNFSAPAFADIDRHFARLVERLAGGAQPELALAAALVSRNCGEGNSCLDLRDRAGIAQLVNGEGGRSAELPPSETWLEKLRASSVVGTPGEFKPLVLDAQGRLYLHRYWEYESELAAAIRRRAGTMAGWSQTSERQLASDTSSLSTRPTRGEDRGEGSTPVQPPQHEPGSAGILAGEPVHTKHAGKDAGAPSGGLPVPWFNARNFISENSHLGPLPLGGGEGGAAGGIDEARLADGLKRLFPGPDGSEVDMQKVAALVALRRNLCVISGGPGTGKTRTVALALALLLEQAGEAPLRIALAAPTGKAAARLQESVRQWRDKLECDARVRERFPTEAFTVHRLLGGAPGTAAVRFDAENPLPVDVLVLDEASMVDLAMMAKLFAALPEQARIILIGDRDQLASVEAGAVLGDICGPRLPGVAATVRSQSEDSSGKEHDAGAQRPASSPHDLTVAATLSASGGLADCIVQLEKNYRFAPGSGILELSRAVNRGDSEGARRVLISAPGVSAATLPAASGLKAALRPVVMEHFAATVSAREPQTALAALSRFRLLTALRQGPFGAENLNRLVEEILSEAGLISAAGPWYFGRPVLVTENDYSLRLFNGDVGIILPEPESGQPRAFFGGADGQVRGVSPARLPRHETVFAMTVHKCQGSEFERVLLVLPDRESPVLTRELVYTGITRASEGVEVWMSEPVFRAAVVRRVQRASGLREALWPQ
jgi:exodeoxyribonuclease V alpha subunit